jgi:Raf kinase inhibitor-like YbhB/YbcL family protein
LQSSHSQIRTFSLIPIVLATAIFFTSCGSGNGNNTEFDPESSLIASLAISSAAFADGDSIPVEYTCDGNNTSPPLRWSDVPGGTRSIAILVDDPDAPVGIFRHWSVYNIPSGSRSLQAGQANTVKLKDSTRQAFNTFNKVGYSGPCPSEKQDHEYVFFIYALSEPLDLDDDATALDVSAALRGKVLGTGSFSGMYARR